MKNVLAGCLLLSMLAGLSAAPDSDTAVNTIPLEVQQSKYIEMLGAGVGSSEGSMAFEGHFIVLGQGVFGHFDVVAFDDSGKVIRLMKSDSRAYGRDQGARVKSISMNLGSSDKCVKVEVSFHEMRLEPDVGACVSKK